MANPDLICLEAKWHKILSHLEISNNLEDLNCYKRLNKLKNITFFKHFSEAKLMGIVKKMYRKQFKPSETIFKEGTEADSFYMIVQGRVKIYKAKKLIRELDEGCCFGEIGLINNDTRSATITASSEVNCFVLTKDNFHSLLDKKIIDNLRRRIYLFDSQILLTDLYYVKLLGKGKFGIVNLVHNYKHFYAIKSVSKKLVQENPNIAKYLQNERRILLSLDHPFIMRLVKTMRDGEYIYFLNEHIRGATLEKAISELTGKKQDIASKKLSDIQFYLGSLLLIVEYIHWRKILHRDLKPANLMVDASVID